MRISSLWELMVLFLSFVIAMVEVLKEELEFDYEVFGSSLSMISTNRSAIFFPPISLGSTRAM